MIFVKMMTLFKRYLAFISGPGPWLKIIITMGSGLAIAEITKRQIVAIDPLVNKTLDPLVNNAELIIAIKMLVVWTLLNVPMRFLHFYCSRSISESVSFNVRQTMFNHIQKIPFLSLQKFKEGDYVSQLVNDSKTFANGMLAGFDFLREPIIIFLMLYQAFQIDTKLTLLFLLITPVLILVFNLVGKKVKKYQSQIQDSFALMNQRIGEAIAGQMIIKTYGLKKYCLQRLALAHEKFLKYQLKSVRAEELAPPIIEMMIIATLGFIILIAFQQKVSHGAFVAFVTAMFRIRESIRVLTGSFVKLAQAQAADQRLQLTLAMPMEDTGNKTIPHFQQKLELINVSLMIDEKIILKNFSLTINKGEKVALLGASGSGKSTILSLLLKLIKPSTGSVHMDGIDLEELNNRHYRNFFSYIGQENFIVNDTLKENILFANDATATNNSNYQKALDYSLVRPILAQMPETDLTFLGDRGSRLSGGEKQRVTIARGMNKPAEILLLDEATSALDQENLLKIENHFLQYFSQKTILMVTHRLTQGQKFDKIVILRDGEKLAEGSYDDLLHKFPEYKNLYFSESVL